MKRFEVGDKVQVLKKSITRNYSKEHVKSFTVKKGDIGTVFTVNYTEKSSKVKSYINVQFKSETLLMDTDEVSHEK